LADFIEIAGIDFHDTNIIIVIVAFEISQFFEVQTGKHILMVPPVSIKSLVASIPIAPTAPTTKNLLI
jgi:hypothetical protein